MIRENTAIRSDAAEAAGNQSISAVEDGLISLFADCCHQLGLPRSYGQIYGLAFVLESPISFDDVVRALGLSKGSASQGIRWLRDMGILRRVDAPVALKNGHARREFFVPLVDISDLLRVIVRERLRGPLESGRGRLALLQRQVDGRRASGSDGSGLRVRHLRRQMQRLQTWHRKVAELAPLSQQAPG